METRDQFGRTGPELDDDPGAVAVTEDDRQPLLRLISIEVFARSLDDPGVLAHFEWALGVTGRAAVLRAAFPDADTEQVTA